MIIFHEPDKVLGASSGGIGHQVIHLRPLQQVIWIEKTIYVKGFTMSVLCIFWNLIYLGVWKMSVGVTAMVKLVTRGKLRSLTKMIWRDKVDSNKPSQVSF